MVGYDKKTKQLVYHKMVFSSKTKDKLVQGLHRAFDRGSVKSFEWKTIGKTKNGNPIWDFKITLRKVTMKKKKR